MATNSAFSVVEFAEEDGILLVEVVPSSWTNLSKNTCRWPRLSGPKFRKLVRDCKSLPSKDWDTYPSKVLKTCGKSCINFIAYNNL